MNRPGRARRSAWARGVQRQRGFGRAAVVVVLALLASVLVPVPAAQAAPPAPHRLASAAAVPPLPSPAQVIAAPAATDPIGVPAVKPVQVTPHELTDKRTATSSVMVNKDGSKTLRQYVSPRYFRSQSGGGWQPIDSSLMPDRDPEDVGSRLAAQPGDAAPAFKVRSNEWQARFASSDFADGMVRIREGNSQIGLVPQSANMVVPVISTRDGGQVVRYRDLWPGVDLEYTVSSSAVKESIVLKDKHATSSVSFKVLGATPKPNKDGGFALTGALNDQFSIPPVNLILNNFGPVTDTTAFSQTTQGSVVTVKVRDGYLGSLPDNAFPAVVDPGFRST